MREDQEAKGKASGGRVCPNVFKAACATFC